MADGVAVGLGTVGVIVGIAVAVGVAGTSVRVWTETGVEVDGSLVGNTVCVGEKVAGVGRTTEAGVELVIRQTTNTPTMTTIRITPPTAIHRIGRLGFSSSRCGCARLTRRKRQASLPRGGGALGVSGELKRSPFC